MKNKALVFLCAAFVSVAAAGQEKLAVLPFSGGASGEGDAIAELFSFSPELKQAFAVIPRTSISRAIAAEQEFQMGAGMTDPDTIAAIGRQIGATYIVSGNITRLGRRNLLIISILKIDELRQIAGDIQTYTKIEEIQDKLPDMARNIVDAAGRTPLEADKLAVARVAMGGDVDSQMADTLAQILSIHLIKSGKYLVYPRTATLEQVQAEYDTQLSGVTADESLVDMGKGDNPKFVLSVAARRLGSRNMFNASIINLESGVQLTGDSADYKTLDDGVEAMATLSRKLTGATGSPRRYGGKGDSNWGAVLGYGALNLGLGLGSFIQGDWGGGLTLLAGYGAAAGLIAWDLSLEYEDKLAGIPGSVGIGVAGLAVLYGFIRPAIYQRNQRLAVIADRITIAVVPRNRGGEAVRLSYTLKF